MFCDNVSRKMCTSTVGQIINTRNISNAKYTDKAQTLCLYNSASQGHHSSTSYHRAVVAFDENDSFRYCAHIFIDASNCRASACSTKLATTFCNMSVTLNGLTVDLLCSTCSPRILSDVKPRNMDHSIGVAYRLLCHCRAFRYRIVVLLKERITLCFITVYCVANSDGCRFRLEQHVYHVCYKRFVDGNFNWCVYSLRRTQTGSAFNLIATHFSPDCLSYDPPGEHKLNVCMAGWTQFKVLCSLTLSASVVELEHTAVWGGRQAGVVNSTIAMVYRITLRRLSRSNKPVSCRFLYYNQHSNKTVADRRLICNSRSDCIVNIESCHFKDAAQLEIKQLKAEVKETASTPKWG